MEVPCSSYIILILVEKDILSNDGNALRIPCFYAGKQSYDFNIAGGTIKAIKDKY